MEKACSFFVTATRKGHGRCRSLPLAWRRQRSCHVVEAPSISSTENLLLQRHFLGQRRFSLASIDLRKRIISSSKADGANDQTFRESSNMTAASLSWNDNVHILAQSSKSKPSEKEKLAQLRQGYQLLEELVNTAWQDDSTKGEAENHINTEGVSSKLEQAPTAEPTILMENTKPDAAAALELLDSIIRLEQESIEDTTLHYTISSSNALNIILQLWRTELVERETYHGSKRPGNNVFLPYPKEMLIKLDDYRMFSSSSTSSLIVMPEAHSYNILLGAAASLGQLQLCQQVYDWMWEESLVDPLVQPDRVTLRAMFQAILHPSNTGENNDNLIDAAGQCEQILQDYLSRQLRGHGKASGEFPVHLSRDIAAIYQSLVHVWAAADPWQARSYLMDMLQRHLEHIDDIEQSPRYPAPDVMTWNRVISALAIQHGQPEAAMQLLDEFWTFSKQLTDRRRREQKQAAEQSLILTNAHHANRGTRPYAGIPQPDLFSYNSILEGWAQLENAAQANKVYALILKQSDPTKDIDDRRIRPNIVTFTSAIKANGGNLDRVHEISQDCLREYQEQNRLQLQDEEKLDPNLVLDHAFFHAWLKACVQASQNGDSAAAVTTAETVLLELMPTVGISPRSSSFGFLLQCFTVQDDLEGATHWLLKHASRMEEASVVRWALELSEMGEIELVSFLDRFWTSSKDRKPKTLLQVLVKDENLKSAEALGQVLRKVPAEQGLQILNWIPEENRTCQHYGTVLRAMAKEGFAEGAEELWERFQKEISGRRNRMVDDDKPSPFGDRTGDMYTSLIVAWSRNGNIERARYWWDVWILDDEFMKEHPPTRTAQTALLSCYADEFKPKQAEAFMKELRTMYQEGQLPDAPDLVMYNLILKAWVLAAAGSRAQKFLEQAIHHHGVTPDVISYNSVVQAYVKERRMDKATDYVKAYLQDQQDFPTRQVGFPDFATFRSILGGWSLYRQDYQVAFEESKILFQWMKDLYDEGILQEDPETDRDVLKLMAECKQRHLRPRKNQRSHEKNEPSKKQISSSKAI